MIIKFSPRMWRVRILMMLGVSTGLLAACGGGEDAGPLDARNASYTAFAANGEQFILKVNFDQSLFGLQKGNPSVVLEDGFGSDAVPETYVLRSQAGAGKTERFRYRDDLIVGNHILDGIVQPFVAGRRFAQSFKEAAGLYNHFGITQRAAGTAESKIYTSRIDVDGTMRICDDGKIHTVAKCPMASIRNYTVSIAGETFTATPTGTAIALPFNFRVALAGTEAILLMADIDPDGSRSFQIGLAESANSRSGQAWGGTVQGAWARSDFDTHNYSSEGTAVDGSATNYSGSIAPMGIDAPQGILSFDGGHAFIVQNSQLMVLIGTASSGSAGFMQIGVR